MTPTPTPTQLVDDVDFIAYAQVKTKRVYPVFWDRWTGKAVAEIPLEVVRRLLHTFESDVQLQQFLSAKRQFFAAARRLNAEHRGRP